MKTTSQTRISAQSVRRAQGSGLGPVLGSVLALLLAALAAPLAAQQVSDEGFAEVIDVRVVNLEVVVEEDGSRVLGLQPEDFVLEVDGQEVPIEYFTEVVGGTAEVRSESGGDATVPAQAPGKPVGTSFLVFIDNYWSIPSERNQVLDGLIEQLPNITQNDRMAVVAFDGKQVEMVSNWSSSVNGLTRALRQAKDQQAYGLQRLSEERAFQSRGELVAEGLLSEREIDIDFGLSIEEEQFASSIADKVERSVMAASSTLRSFAQPPGRKVMLLLSGGWPSDPARWVVTDPTRDTVRSRIAQGRDLIGILADTANRLGYTLYPVDVPGIDATDIDASKATLDTAEVARFDARQREREEEATLYALADMTGGQAMINGARGAALERAVADTRSYYWLGFTPSWQGDDSQHTVEVSTRNKRHKIRTRKNFLDLSRSSEVTMMVESVLLFGDPPGGIPLQAEVSRGKSAGFGKREVPLRIQIPLDALTFLPTSAGYETRAELRIAVLDEGGARSEIPVIPFQLRGESPPPEDAVYPYEVPLKMRKQRHDLVVSLYDSMSGRILSTKLVVPKM